MKDKKQKPNRIPVRFVGNDEAGQKPEPAPEDTDANDSPVSSEEIGKASSYEDETEVQSRIDEGDEVREETAQPEAEESHEAVEPLSDERAAADDTRDRAVGVEKAGASPNHSSSIQAKPEGPMLAELLATRAELKRVEAEVADFRDKLSRRQADFDNYRKRVERDRGETYNRMVGDVVSKLLPVVDNFRRALDAEAFVQASESEEFRHFLHGIELIFKQLEDVLGGLGLEHVVAVGKPFDPHVHEAVVIEETEEYEPDTVMQELVRGYRLGDKLLRPAMVKVATRHSS